MFYSWQYAAINLTYHPKIFELSTEFTYPGVRGVNKYCSNMSWRDEILEMMVKCSVSFRFFRYIKSALCTHDRVLNTWNQAQRSKKIALLNYTLARIHDQLITENLQIHHQDCMMRVACFSCHWPCRSSSYPSPYPLSLLSSIVRGSAIQNIPFSNATVCNRLVHRFIGPLLRCTFTTAERISLSFQTTFDHTNTSQYNYKYRVVLSVRSSLLPFR